MPDPKDNDNKKKRERHSSQSNPDEGIINIFWETINQEVTSNTQQSVFQ